MFRWQAQRLLQLRQHIESSCRALVVRAGASRADSKSDAAATDAALYSLPYPSVPSHCPSSSSSAYLPNRLQPQLLPTHFSTSSPLRNAPTPRGDHEILRLNTRDGAKLHAYIVSKRDHGISYKRETELHTCVSAFHPSLDTGVVHMGGEVWKLRGMFADRTIVEIRLDTQVSI